ncbi:C-type lectin 37Da-like [Cylas formicarius]|uniref:C-type lectin 37Da-like n=1 Tax=Cylas formicarius TaxID=197179 RepID=UPI002958391B|nr:C-type lectin 37Da-like [Cylas formicarius]
MNLIISILLILSPILLLTAQHLSANEKGYYISKDKQDFLGALTLCKTYGLELVSLRTPEDEAELDYALNEFNASTEVGYWLAGTKLKTGDWYWVTTGNMVLYTNWGDGQPDNSGGYENCLELGNFNQYRQPRKWNDLNCTIELNFICKQP